MSELVSLCKTNDVVVNPIISNAINEIANTVILFIFLSPSSIPSGASVLGLVLYLAKVKTTHILSSFSVSSRWRESLSFLVVGNVNG